MKEKTIFGCRKNIVFPEQRIARNSITILCAQEPTRSACYTCQKCCRFSHF